ncbi:MAG: calcium-binding protein [Cyanobacteria bacterium J06639_14]
MPDVNGTVSNDTMTVFTGAAGGAEIEVHRDVLEYKTIWDTRWLAKREGNMLRHAHEGDWSNVRVSNAIDTTVLGNRAFRTINNQGQYVSDSGSTSDFLLYTNWNDQLQFVESQGNTFVQRTVISGDFSINGGEGNDNIRVYGGDQTILGGNGNDTLIDTGLDGMGSVDYITWDGGRWSVRREGNQFIHAPNGDWGRSQSSNFIDYKYGGNNWRARFDGSNFEHALNGDWNNSHFGPIMTITNWSNVHESVSLDGDTFIRPYTASVKANVLYGGEGNDTIHVLGTNSIAYGENGADLLYGGEGTQTLIGGAGDDTLVGGKGHDTLQGGDGIDTTEFSGNPLDYEFSSQNDLLTIQDKRGFDGIDTLSSIEKIHFKGNNTTYSLVSDPNRFLLSAGNGDPHIIVGSSRNNKLVGSKGNDTLKGGDGIDTAEFSGNPLDYEFSHQNGLLTIQDKRGFDGIDTLSSIEKIHFKGNNTTYSLVSDPNRLFFSASIGDPHIIVGSNSADWPNVLNGNDRIATIGNGNDFIYGGSGVDVISSRGGNDFISAGSGNDHIVGGGGNDTIYGGEGSDIVQFSGVLADYTLSFLSDKRLRVQDNRGIDGVDTLYDTEMLFFAENPSLYQVTTNFHRNENLKGATNRHNIIQGNDFVDEYIEGGFYNDIIDGKGGINDSVYFDNSVENYTFSFQEDGALIVNDESGKTGIDTLRGIEYLHFNNSLKYEVLVGDATDNFMESKSNGSNPYNRYAAPVGFSYLMHGGAGNDTLKAFQGFNSLILQRQANLRERGLRGPDWSNYIENSVLYGGTGNDKLIAGVGDDELYGETGDDILFAGRGNDHVFGGEGNDYLYATAAANGHAKRLYGGQGADTFFLELQGQSSINLNFDTQKLANFINDITIPPDEGFDWARFGTDMILAGVGAGLGAAGPAGSLLNSVISIGADLIFDEFFSKNEADAQIERAQAHIPEYDATPWGEVVIQNDHRDLVIIEDFQLGVDTIVLPNIIDPSLEDENNPQPQPFGYNVIAPTNGYEGGALIQVVSNKATESTQNVVFIKNTYREFGITDEDFASTLRDMIAGNVISTFKTTGIIGTSDDNVYNADNKMTFARDVIKAGNGNDTVTGLFGDDLILGQAGDDTLYGGTFNDEHRNKLLSTYQHDGNDILKGGSGNDILFGETGNDILVGGADADRFAFMGLNEGIDIIKDFSQAENDIIQIDRAGFGARSTSQFQFDAATGALSFNNQQFATLENAAASGFSIDKGITFV